MATLQGWRVFGNSFPRTFARRSGNLASAPNINQPHIYKRRFTEEQLTKYIIDNVVYSDYRYVVSRVPQGINFSHGGFTWTDSVGDQVCDKSLQDILQNLLTPFKTSELFIVKHPRRNASGLLLFSKSLKVFHNLRKSLLVASMNFVRIYTYLVVVFGSPPETCNETFAIDHKSEQGVSYTQILEQRHASDTRMVNTRYAHTVKDSTKKFSLVEISVSYDKRDCARHIVAQRFFTPVLGDSWNIRRITRFLFGVPLVSDPKMPEEGLYQLDKETLEKLQLTSENQDIIPVHAHLYNLAVPLEKDSVLFASVPPPDYFVWTCQQLGLHKIEQYMTPEFWNLKGV